MPKITPPEGCPHPEEVSDWLNLTTGFIVSIRPPKGNVHANLRAGVSLETQMTIAEADARIIALNGIGIGVFKCPALRSGPCLLSEQNKCLTFNLRSSGTSTGQLTTSEIEQLSNDAGNEQAIAEQQMDDSI
jgi:hypothetical protein